MQTHWIPTRFIRREVASQVCCVYKQITVTHAFSLQMGSHKYTTDGQTEFELTLLAWLERKVCACCMHSSPQMT